MEYFKYLRPDVPFYRIDVDWHKNNQKEICQWLDCQDGDGYSLGGFGVYFYSEQDAVFFSLRWV